ncbi:MAG TPA: TPM domain-containing protein [Candidatus Acidoferrales bacterium]|nr:TPM domain-containing protein [Candidatus Acidoferrales bacterium]
MFPRKLRIIAVLLAAVGVLAAPKPGRVEDPAQLKQRGYVNDFAGLISESDSSRIGDICRTLDEHTGDRLLVVTVHTTGNLPPSQFAEQLRKSWIGVSEIRERTIVIVGSGQGKMGFSIGSTLETILTDEKFDAAVRGALAAGGSYFGEKLVYLVQRIAEDLDAAGSYSGAPSRTAPAGPAANATAPATKGSGQTHHPPEWVMRYLIPLLMILLFFVLSVSGRRIQRRVVIIFGFLCSAGMLYLLNWMVAQLGHEIQLRVWIFLAVGVAGGLLGVEARHRTAIRSIEIFIYGVTGVALAAIMYELHRLWQARPNL